MLGMDRYTGKSLTDAEHIRQSIHDILTTDEGTRVMLRDYAGKIDKMIDKTANELFHVELISSVSGAIERWEPRFKINSVTIDKITSDGRVILSVDGTILINSQVVKIEGIVI